MDYITLKLDCDNSLCEGCKLHFYQGKDPYCLLFSEKLEKSGYNIYRLKKCIDVCKAQSDLRDSISVKLTGESHVLFNNGNYIKTLEELDIAKAVLIKK